ncbi:MAG: chemotaxis protein CheB [Flavobacteriales bacterium]
MTYEAVVLGASAGGMQLVKNLVTSLPNDFGLPLIIVQHVGDNSDNVWPNLLNECSQVLVKEADEKEPIQRGTVYLAPPNYHLLIEPDHSFTLTIDERVNYARPAIDVLFETAAEAYREKLIGIVCTGGNFDGAKGLLRIKELGGMTIAQDPETAEASAMPKAAIQTAHPDYVLSLDGIKKLLLEIHTAKTTSHELEN